MTKLEEMLERIRQEWKCTCNDCGHINEDYDMDDLCDLITEVWNEAIKECEERKQNDV